MSTFLITIDDGRQPIEAPEIHDVLQDDLADMVSVEKIEVIHQPEAAGGEGQVGLIYRVLGVA